MGFARRGFERVVALADRKGAEASPSCQVIDQPQTARAKRFLNRLWSEWPSLPQRKSRRSALPEGLRGTDSTNSTRLGSLKGANDDLRKPITSSALQVHPGFKAT
jgi:hypothetical protein